MPLAIVMGCLFACHPRVSQPDSGNGAGSPASATSMAPLALGDIAVLPMVRVRFVSQRDCGKAAGSSGRSPLRSWAGELEITNIGSRRVPANPFYATLTDDQGFDYTTNLTDCGGLMPSRMLEPSEQVRGFIPFEIPAALDSVMLTYRPAPRDRKPAEAARFRVEL